MRAARDERFAEFLERMRAATDQFYRGNAGPYLEICSHREDVTRFGGWGGVEHGWAELSRRFETTTAHFAGGTVAFEPLEIYATDDLACVVGFERGEVRLVDRDEPERLASRVTHVYRREEDGWKLVHRHADPLVTTQRD